jgi:hypothetical protein
MNVCLFSMVLTVETTHIKTQPLSGERITCQVKKMKYRVHRFDINMTSDQSKLEKFLNSLEGEVVAIIPNITPFPVTLHARIDFLLIVEKVSK